MCVFLGSTFHRVRLRVNFDVCLSLSVFYLSIHPSISRSCPLTSQIQVVEPIIIEDEVVVQNLYTCIPEVKVVEEEGSSKKEKAKVQRTAPPPKEEEPEPEHNTKKAKAKVQRSAAPEAKKAGAPAPAKKEEPPAPEPVEKIVEVEKIVTKEVPVDRLVFVEVPVKRVSCVYVCVCVCVCVCVYHQSRLISARIYMKITITAITPCTNMCERKI